MPEPDIIQVILKDSKYNLSIFSENEIQSLQNKIFKKTVRSKEAEAFIDWVKSEKLSFWK